MAFCHECGSEVSSDEAFCSVCGIALHNPVLEDLKGEDDTAADLSSESGAGSAPVSGEEVELGAESAREAAETSEPDVPDDEFVDISALRDDDDDIPGVPLREKGPEPEPIPEGDFVDISALRDEETAASPSEVASEEADVPNELGEGPPEGGMEPEPPAPAILSGEDAFESAPVEPAAITEPVAEAEARMEDSADVIIESPELPAQPDQAAETTEPSVEDTPEPPAAETFEPPVADTPEPPAAETFDPPIADTLEPPAAETLEPPIADTPEPPAAETFERAAEEETPSFEAAETPEFEVAEPAVEEDAPTFPEPEATSLSETADTPLVDEFPPAPGLEDERSPEPPLSGIEPPSAADVTVSEDLAAPEAEAEDAAPEPSYEAPEPETPIDAVKEEPVPDEAPGFLEDATLIAMPIPPASSQAAKEDTAVEIASGEPEVKQEMADSSQQVAPAAEAEPVSMEMPESPDEEPVPHSEDGETTLEEGFTPEAAADSPEDEPARHQTTPNIGGADTDGSKAPKLKPLTEGTVLNSRYEIVRKIGGGGMGAVYLASDKNLGGVLRAVKEMVQSYIEEDQQEKAVQDFKRESMLLTSLEHPSIPTIYDYFFDETAHRFYLVMKYISGGDLAAKLRSAADGKLSEEEVTEWAIQIADVLDYLHNRQPPIVYRDLKPANIMLDGNSGKVMLIDFGIARWINKEEKGVTAVGTMGYAPPELFSGNVVPSSDIYSLGSTMFHLLTGADPQNNPLLIFDFEKNPKPRQINSRLSDQIESILMRSVEYNAEKRFASAAEMRDALTEHLARLNAGTITYGKTESPKSVGFSDQSVFCGFCGQKIVATDMFCAFCGAKQPLAQPGVQSQEYIPVRLTAKLMIEGTSQLDYPSFELAKDENLVGRRDPMSNIFPEVDLSKFDPQTKISRKHARIFRDGDNFMLEDLGSSNGTILIPPTNESLRLNPHQAQVLTHGDRIRLGDTVLHFVVTA